MFCMNTVLLFKSLFQTSSKAVGGSEVRVRLSQMLISGLSAMVPCSGSEQIAEICIDKVAGAGLGVVATATAAHDVSANRQLL